MDSAPAAAAAAATQEPGRVRVRSVPSAAQKNDRRQGLEARTATPAVSGHTAEMEKASTADMVKDAIKTLGERGGSSLYNIKKYIEAVYQVDMRYRAPRIRVFLRAAVSDGDLVQTRGRGASGSFKLPPKKQPPAAAAAATPGAATHPSPSTALTPKAARKARASARAAATSAASNASSAPSSPRTSATSVSSASTVSSTSTRDERAAARANRS